MSPQELAQGIWWINQLDNFIDQCGALIQLIGRIRAELPCETEETLSDWLGQAVNGEAELKKALPKLVSLFRKIERELGGALEGSPPILEAIVKSVGLKATGLIYDDKSTKKGDLVELWVLITDGTGRPPVVPSNPGLAIQGIRKAAFDLINESGNFGNPSDGNKYDIDIRFAREDVQGNSVGLLIGILIVCHFAGLKFPDRTSATGQLDGSGTVCKVGGIPEKLEAAKKLKAAEESNRQEDTIPVLIPQDNQGDVPEKIAPVEAIPVNSLHKAMRVIFPEFPYPRWHFERLRQVLLPEPEEGSPLGQRISQWVEAIFDEKVTGDLSRHVKYPRKMTVCQAIERTGYRMILRGSQKTADLIIRDVAAHYVKPLLEGKPKRDDHLIPIRIDLQQYGWAGKNTLVDLVEAELQAPNARFEKEFLAREINKGRILLLCRNTPSNQALRRSLTAELNNLVDPTDLKIILHERALDRPGITFPLNDPTGSWRRRRTRLLTSIFSS